VVQSGVAETWTILRVLDWTAGRFDQAGFESGRLEAQVLLAHVLSCDRVALYTHFDQPLAPEELAEYRGLIKRRLAGEPTAYLTGAQEFWSLPFAVDERVLIPRRDTETLIEVVLDHVEDRSAELRIADVGTGCGAIAVALAHELGAARIVATDVSVDALSVARENAERNLVADRVELRRADLCSGFADGEQFDVVAANLPYIPSGQVGELMAEVRCEPRAALDGGEDGLDLVRRLILEAGRHLVAGGLLVLEHGWDQGSAVADLLVTAGVFHAPEARHDLAGEARVAFASRQGVDSANLRK
jgi:release factor glutamine methyltransferase